MTQPPQYPGSGDETPGNGGSGEPPSWQNGQNQPPPYGQQPPYGQDPGSYGQPGYGQPGYGQDQPAWGQDQGYGQAAYGQAAYQGQPYGSWQGGNDLQRGTNGTSIAAFVLNLTPCGLVIPGWICAVIGLGQIKRDGSKGRWMAITSLVMGVLWAIVIGLLVWGSVWVFGQIVTPDNAKVGQCVEVSTSEDAENEIGLMKKDCGDEHDGEIVAVKDLTADDLEGVLSDTQLCEAIMDADVRAAVEGYDAELEINGVSKDPPPGEGDTFVCYVEKADGGKLSEQITP